VLSRERAYRRDWLPLRTREVIPKSRCFWWKSGILVKEMGTGRVVERREYRLRISHTLTELDASEAVNKRWLRWAERNVKAVTETSPDRFGPSLPGELVHIHLKSSQAHTETRYCSYQSVPAGPYALF
jgi:hypothetical protein